MKYRIVIQKQRPQNGDNGVPQGRDFNEGYDNVFTAEIGADEAIEFLSTSMNISKRR